MAPSSRGKGAPPTREVQVSKKLSWLLRHGAEEEGLKLDNNGYVNLADALANRKLKSLKVTFEEVLTIVKDNDKQRFALMLDPAKFDAATEPTSDNPADYLIRANQGHSIKLAADSGLLTPMSMDNAPSMAVHGTTHAKWMLIVQSGGLKPMERNHVHFASGLPEGFKRMADSDSTSTEAPVISGMRARSSILMYLSIPKALEYGMQLGTSANGVILTAGNADGLVPLELFDRVEDRDGLGVLLEDGKIVKEAPSTWARKHRSAG